MNPGYLWREAKLVVSRPHIQKKTITTKGLFYAIFYALVNVFQPDWLIRSNFLLRATDNLHIDSHQNSWIPTGKLTPSESSRPGAWGYVIYYPRALPGGLFLLVEGSSTDPGKH